MRPVNSLQSLLDAGYQIIAASGDYVLVTYQAREVLLAWTGEHWVVRG